MSHVFRRKKTAPSDINSLISLLFGSVDPALNHQLHYIATQAIAAGNDPLRALILQVDQQLVPTRVVKRFGPDDIEWIAVGHLLIATDSSEGSVSPQVATGYEPHVRRALENLLGPGAAFVDVGANIGVHVAQASQLVGPSGRVVAVEPNPENCRLLLLTLAKNGLANVDLIPTALGQSGDWTWFGTHIGSNGGLLPNDLDAIADGYGFVVPVRRLDDIAPHGTKVIKVDVEGAEISVLKSGLETIARDRPSIIMEFSTEMVQRVSRIDASTALTWVESLGYRIAVLDKTTTDPLPMSAENMLATWGSPARIEDLLLIPN